MKGTAKGCALQTISTLTEAAAELARLTGQHWTETALLDFASQSRIPLHAVVPISESDITDKEHAEAEKTRVLKELTAIEAKRGKRKAKNITGGTAGLWRAVETWNDVQGTWAIAPVPPMCLRMLVLNGTTAVRHPFDGPRDWLVRELPVTLDQVRLKAETLVRIQQASQTDPTFANHSQLQAPRRAPLDDVRTPTWDHHAPIAKAKESAPRTAATATEVKLKRAAFIKAHAHEWPTIAADLSDASDNGLSKAARVPDQHGMWFVERAKTWARERGKLPGSKPPATKGTSMADLPRQLVRRN